MAAARLLHLPLIGIALGDRCAWAGHAPTAAGDRKYPAAVSAMAARICAAAAATKPGSPGIAADPRCGRVKPAFFAARVPVLQRRGRGGGGILRIERQQHDFVGRKRLHRPRRAVAERMPAAHGDKGLGFHAVADSAFSSASACAGFPRRSANARRYGRRSCAPPARAAGRSTAPAAGAQSRAGR